MKIRLIFFLFIPYCLFSQDLSIEIGSVSSDFRYLNSEGATLDYFVKDPSLSLGFDWSQNIRNRQSCLWDCTIKSYDLMRLKIGLP